MTQLPSLLSPFLSPFLSINFTMVQGITPGKILELKMLVEHFRHKHQLHFARPSPISLFLSPDDFSDAFCVAGPVTVTSYTHFSSYLKIVCRSTMATAKVCLVYKVGKCECWRLDVVANVIGETVC